MAVSHRCDHGQHRAHPAICAKTNQMKQGRHKGAGKGTYTSCSEGGGPLRGGLPTPLSKAFSGA
eukprot:scaffold4633_cov114-Isochrysis_galbana.AAC.7